MSKSEVKGLIFIVLALAGCDGSGANRAEVHGTVTTDDQPIQSGTVRFIPTEGTTGPSTGGAIENGKYRLDSASGPVVGRHRVEIRARRKTGRKIESGFPDPPGTLVDHVAQFIPARYNVESDLVVEVKRGSNSHDFHLTVGDSRSEKRGPVP